jgi:hypothetical protein
MRFPLVFQWSTTRLFPRFGVWKWHYFNRESWLHGSAHLWRLKVIW